MLRTVLITILTPVFCFTLSVKHLTAQTRTINTLKQKIQSTATAKDRLSAILILCDQGYTLPPDTLMLYAEEAKKLALQQYDLHSELMALYYQSFSYTNKGLLDSALDIANDCISRLSKTKVDHALMANLLNQKGRCFVRKNQYQEAIKMGYEVIDNAEKVNDTLLQIKGKTLIGWAYLEMNQLKDALNWHLQALHTTNNNLLLEHYGILFANLALNYKSLGNVDSAFYYIEKAVAYSRKNENLFALSNSLAIKAQFLVSYNDPHSAENILKEVIAIRKQIGDPFYIVSDICQLGLFYAQNGQPKKGIAICNEGLVIAKKYKIDTKLFFLYNTLAENYKAMGDMRSFSEQLQHIIDWKDSVYSKNSAEAIAELQAKYHLAKKQNLIIKQQVNISQQRLRFWALFSVAVLAGVIVLLLFIGYKRRHRLKLQLLMQDEKRMRSEAIYKAKEAERQRISRDLHDSMGAYISAISANADELIMQSVHSTGIIEKIKNNAKELMMNLRDTIWVLNRQAISITGISDRLKLFIQKIKESYSNVEIRLNENITKDISLTPEQSLNLLRILQEGLNNALKHSNADVISIDINSHDDLKISITDNGIGFISANSKGYGIDNMKARAKESGFQLYFKQTQPKGTEMMLTADTKN